METRFPDSCAAKFRPVKPLASGGFGAVWEAVQLGLDRTVAVKVPGAHALADPEERSHFEREARVTALLDSRHVVRVIDWGLEDGAWIAYELLPGPTLRAHLDAGRPTLAEALGIVRQVALALDAAHRAGIIHRDIKPENVMAAGPGWWKVMDFGVARWLASSTRTKTGIILGTPLYISPEQVRGDRATAAADLYALGVMLFEMLTGTLPHDAPRPIDILLKRIQEPAPRLAGLRPDVPPRIDALVARLLDPDPLARYASAESLVRELDDALPDSTRAPDAGPAAESTPLAAPKPAADRRDTVSSSRPDMARLASADAPVKDPTRSRTGPARARTAPVPHLRRGVSRRMLGGAVLLAAGASLAAGLLLVRVRARADAAPDGRASTAASARAASPASAAPSPSPTGAGALSIADLLRSIPVELRVFPGDGARQRCALVVPYASSAVTLELAAGWRLKGLDGRAREGAGAVALGALGAGLHWVEVEGKGRAEPGIVRGLAPGPEPPPPDAARAEMEALHHELMRLAHSRHAWEDEVKLAPPHGPDGSARALAQAALMMRQASEVPDAFNLAIDPSGKVRLTYDFEAIQVRQRAAAVLHQVERALAARAERWDAWHVLGWLLANADQRAMGRLALARAVELWPASPWSWAELVRLERRDLRELEDGGMPRALLREVQGRTRHAYRKTETHAKEIAAALDMKRLKVDLDALGRGVRADDARVR